MGPIQNKPMLKGSTEGKVYKGKTVKDTTDQTSQINQVESQQETNNTGVPQPQDLGVQTSQPGAAQQTQPTQETQQTQEIPMTQMTK